MARIPAFIEVVESKETTQYQICRRIMPLLFQRKIAPLPFAGSLEEARTVLASLRLRNMSPSIFVINTFWAEELLPELDKMMGQTPALFFRRSVLEAGSTSTFSAIAGPPSSDKTSMVMRQLTPRLTSVWGFGSRTADALAAKAAEAIALFLADGKFEHIERASPQRTETSTFRNAFSEAQQNLAEFRMAFDSVPRVPAATTASAPAVGTQGGIHGELSQMGLSTLLLMIEMEKKSGEVILQRTVETGRIYLSKGRVLAAFVEGPLAPPQARSGAEAIYYLLTWKQGRFDVVHRDINMEDKINTGTTALLMEGARRIDEPDN